MFHVQNPENYKPHNVVQKKERVTRFLSLVTVSIAHLKREESAFTFL